MPKSKSESWMVIKCVYWNYASCYSSRCVVQFWLLLRIYRLSDSKKSRLRVRSSGFPNFSQSRFHPFPVKLCSKFGALREFFKVQYWIKKFGLVFAKFGQFDAPPCLMVRIFGFNAPQDSFEVLTFSHQTTYMVVLYRYVAIFGRF